MSHHLAQINIAKFLRPAEDPVNDDFMNNLDRVNVLAEQSPGFIWRLVGEGDDATDIKAYQDPNIIVNMSVWESVESLSAFVYRNKDHRAMFRRRQEWFDSMEVYFALWWVPIGHEPSVEEGKAKLDLISAHGPTEAAFTFKAPFPWPKNDSQS